MEPINMPWLTRFTRLPEFNILIFAFLLNYPWELIQMPLFATPPANTAYWPVIMMCLGATVADAVIMLIAFWIASAFARSRYWFAGTRRSPFALFIGVGVTITSGIELYATQTGIWAYSPQMPVIFGVGLSPFLQWVFPPPLSIWFIRRQLGTA